MKKPDYELLIAGKQFQQCFARDMTFNEFFVPGAKTMYVSHYHTHYEMLYVYENERLLTVERKKYKLDKNKLFCLPPNIMHKSEICNDKPLKRMLLNFTSEYIHQYTAMFDFDILGCFKQKSHILEVPDEYVDELCKMFRQVEEYSDKSDAYSKQMLAISTLQLLVFCSLKLSACTKTNKILRYLDEHYNDNVTLDDLSRVFGEDKYAISRAFIKETGMSYSQQLARIRINKAMKMMENDDVCITEIATRVGFQTPSYFSKVFKQVTGVTPKEYKKSLR